MVQSTLRASAPEFRATGMTPTGMTPTSSPWEAYYPTHGADPVVQSAHPEAYTHPQPQEVAPAHQQPLAQQAAQQPAPSAVPHFQPGGGPYFESETRIFVGNIRGEIGEPDLRAHFETFGKVTECSLKAFVASGKSKGYAFVGFESRKNTQASMTMRMAA